MLRSCRILAAALTVAAVQLLALPSTAAAQNAHLGVPARDYVTLKYELQSPRREPLGPTRILPDFTEELFEIPLGKLLVITEVEWDLVGPPDPVTPAQVGLTVYDATGSTFNFLYKAEVFLKGRGDTTDPGSAALLTRLTSGIVLDSSVILDRPYVAGIGRPTFQPDVRKAGRGYGRCILRGYLIDEQAP